jgi:DsbC/DsbD-like thiol-disulfide interchange protein
MDKGGKEKRQLVLLGVVLACLAVGKSPAQSASPVVEVRAVLESEGAHPGSTLKAAAVAQIAPGYHINNHKPTLGYLIPTQWKLEASKQVNVEKVVYPKGELKKFAFSDMQLSVYQGRVAVGALLKVARGTRPGTYALKGQFSYQACNDHACLPPKSVPLSLTVRVVRRGTVLKRVNADVFNTVQFD